MSNPTMTAVSLPLLVKLGSLARHAEELHLGDDPHDADLDAIKSLLGDPEVREFFAEYDAKGLLPVMRS